MKNTAGLLPEQGRVVQKMLYTLQESQQPQA